MTVKKDANSSVQARAPATGWVTTSRPIRIPRIPPIRWRNIPPHARIRNVWISSTMPLITRSHPSTITVPIVAAGVMKKAMVPRITITIPSVSSHPHLCLRLSNSISSGLALMCPPKADDCLPVIKMWGRYAVFSSFGRGTIPSTRLISLRSCNAA